MATGRTVNKFTRVYLDGYDMSGYSRTVGPLGTTFDEAELTALSDGPKGYLPNHCNLSFGALNGIFDNTATSGLHVVASGAGTKRTLTAAIGVKAIPAQGDPVFCGQWNQKAYQASDDGGAVVATLPFETWPSDAASLLYQKSWGTLLHANSAVTAANTAVGVDDYGAATTLGGYMVYHVLAGDGTATITVQHAATNADGNFANLGGCTTGSVDFSTVASGMVGTTTRTTSVSRYLRWQIALGTATTVTFVLSFVRMTI